MEGKIIAIKPVTVLLPHVIEMMPLLKDDFPGKEEYASQKLEACVSSTLFCLIANVSLKKKLS